MNEIYDILVTISKDIRTLKSLILKFNKTRLEIFNDEWIDGQNVVQLLHISKRTLQSLRDNNKLPYSRINGKLYYKMSDVEKLLNQNYKK